MKFVVVGLGSMGRRRIRLLKQISNDFIIVGVDNDLERCHQVEKEFGVTTSQNLDLELNRFKPDGVIVSTSPLSHAEIINKALKASCHVFTELNLVDSMYDENIDLSKRQDKILFMSSTLLYRDELCYIREQISDSKRNVNYNYHVGQYLPDWHPWENINDYFVGDKLTNGCRELFSIELPWLIKTFGEIESYDILSDKNTDLPVQYNDNYMLLIKHKGGNKGVVAIDVVSRKPVRNLEVYNEDIYISWAGSPSELKKYNVQNKEEETISLYDEIDQQEGYASFVIENAYKKELEAFVDTINGKGCPRYTFEEDKKVLSIINDIESR